MRVDVKTGSSIRTLGVENELLRTVRGDMRRDFLQKALFAAAAAAALSVAHHSTFLVLAIMLNAGLPHGV